MTQDMCTVCTKPTLLYSHLVCNFCRKPMHELCDVAMTCNDNEMDLPSIVNSYWLCSVECAAAADVRRSLK